MERKFCLYSRLEDEALREQPICGRGETPGKLAFVAQEQFRFQVEAIGSQSLQGHDSEDTIGGSITLQVRLVTDTRLEIKVGRYGSAIKCLSVNLRSDDTKSGGFKALTLEPEAIDIASTPALDTPVERVDAVPDSLILKVIEEYVGVNVILQGYRETDRGLILLVYARTARSCLRETSGRRRSSGCPCGAQRDLDQLRTEQGDILKVLWFISLSMISQPAHEGS